MTAAKTTRATAAGRTMMSVTVLAVSSLTPAFVSRL